MCTFIGTRYLVQEHIAYRLWPLVNEWEMSKEAAAGSSQGGLVYLNILLDIEANLMSQTMNG
jgi:hypothetical protein